jgi:hypothetical protein
VTSGRSQFSRNAATRWNLFLDESGNFSDPDDEVVVAGLLVRVDIPGSHPSQIRAALEAAVPDLPWPVKASEFNRPVVFAIANYLKRRGRAATNPLERVADELVGEITRQESGCYEAVSKALYGRQRIPYDALSRLDDLARRDWNRYQVLRQATDASVAAIGRCIQGLGLSREGDWRLSESARDAVLLVACGETLQGEDAAGDGDLETNRYLGLLRWTIVRAVDVVARMIGRQEVHLYVLDRDVTDTILGVRKRTPLHIRHVGPIARDVEAKCSRDHRITVKLDAVSRYDDRMHAALVLADFVANRTRRGLRAQPDALSAVEGQIGLEVRCCVRSGDPSASHLAAAGYAQETIERVRTASQGTTAEAPVGARSWALEQAAEWTRVLVQ